MSALHEILAYYGMPKENIESASEQIAETYGACRYLDGVKAGAEAVKELAEERKVTLDTPIEDLDLSVRLKACLKAVDCKTVKDILEHNKYDFLRLRTFGRRTLAELEDFLHDNNLELNKQ